MNACERLERAPRAEQRGAEVEQDLRTGLRLLDPQLQRRAQARRRLVVGERRRRCARGEQVVLDGTLGSGDRGCLCEVVREVGEPAPALGSLCALERLRELQVELRATQGTQAVVQRTPNELVRKAVAERRTRQLVDHAAGDGRLQGVESLELPRRSASEDVELEHRARHRGQLEQVPRGGVQPREALADDLADAVGCGDLVQGAREPQHAPGAVERVRLEQDAPELAQQEGVALGEIADLHRQLEAGGIDLAAPRAAGELADVLRAEAGPRRRRTT